MSTRPVATRPARRRHVAGGARIATAGLAATTLLGMVGVYGATRPANSDTPAPAVEPTTSVATPVPVVKIPIDLPVLAPEASETAGVPAPPAPPVPVTAAAAPAPEPAPPADGSTHASR